MLGQLWVVVGDATHSWHHTLSVRVWEIVSTSIYAWWVRIATELVVAVVIYLLVVVVALVVVLVLAALVVLSLAIVIGMARGT